MRLGLALATSIAIVAAAPMSHGATVVQDAILARLAGRLFPTIVELDSSSVPPTVKSILAKRRARDAACGEASGCRLDALRWTDAEVAVVADFAARQTSSDPVEARGAAKRELGGINEILRVYGAGGAPKYPQIDGPDDAGSSQFQADVAAALESADVIKSEPFARLDPSLAVAVALLDGANRLDAIAFEPLDKENVAPKSKATALDWSRYPYTAIILLGVGPEVEGMPLSPLSKLNIHLAAERFQAGMAPFIIVSGAGVHPRRTTYVEAIEMRRALIERYGIPADAIIVEPYARHTTTNLRNAARLLIEFGAPSDRPALIVTNREHGLSVTSQTFISRNITELGYAPGRVGKPVSDYDFPFFWDRKSLRVDPFDPLDP